MSPQSQWNLLSHMKSLHLINAARMTVHPAAYKAEVHDWCVMEVATQRTVTLLEKHRVFGIKITQVALKFLRHQQDVPSPPYFEGWEIHLCPSPRWVHGFLFPHQRWALKHHFSRGRYLISLSNTPFPLYMLSFTQKKQSGERSEEAPATKDTASDVSVRSIFRDFDGEWACLGPKPAAFEDEWKYYIVLGEAKAKLPAHLKVGRR
ncbi:uncharacterized protein PV09_04378 [Verruconis gallopava]|uniref:Uncharacterized protein n=1 Tax=Verruconis gallopava TaxID=253628 RepID=A0A0D1YVC7_9PEZI|nr:uncharacterized protein PV09_04378 [Verruconis gallopava]KIW04632.1 hypothetical protein PV09_04378 [Verruconis gallopava]